jgi:hypothetical protein
MENKTQKLKNFIQKDKKIESKVEDINQIQENDGLFERFDKKIVNSKGQTLLREQLYEAN